VNVLTEVIPNPAPMRDARIVHAMVWTGTGAILTDATIEVRDGGIVAVAEGPGDRGEKDVPTFDASGAWIMPGMIDGHLHLWGARTPHPVHWVVDPRMPNAFRAVSDVAKILQSGFTTVREAGGPLGPSLRQVIDHGDLRGPRIVPAYLGLSRTGGHADCHTLPAEWVEEQPYMGLIADGPLAVRKAVRTVGREGGRWVKIWASGGVLSEHDDPTHVHFFPDELAAIVSEAHAIGLPVGAHSESLLSAKLAIEAGVDAIEHGFELDDEACQRMAEQGIVLVSTLSVLRRYVDWDRGELTDAQRETSRGLLTMAEESLRRAVAAGVQVAMGSDSFAEPMTPFGRSADELAYMTDAGVDAETCLRAATVVAARLAGVERQVGTIEVGKRADLVVLDGDPRETVAQLSTSRRPVGVMKDGVWEVRPA